MARPRIIDLSVTNRNTPPGHFNPCEIAYMSHEEAAGKRGSALAIPEDALVDNRMLASEILRVHTHAGTHLDSPWHFAPTSEGKPSKTIDLIPLDWCYGDGVVLDFSHKKAGELISAKEVQDALTKVNYKLKPFDIVFIRTDIAKNYFGTPDYGQKHPGMSVEATVWLLDQGIKVTGIDAWSWDRPVWAMKRDHKPGVKDIFPNHFLGKEREYCHLENLTNLDQIPAPFGFKVAVLPIKIEKASAGWVRAVAIL